MVPRPEAAGDSDRCTRVYRGESPVWIYKVFLFISGMFLSDFIGSRSLVYSCYRISLGWTWDTAKLLEVITAFS